MIAKKERDIDLKNGLTVGIIARNEEKLLPRCLRSVRPIADEIILVDTGSRDKTPVIARRSGARVLKYKWDNNFSRARNVYLKEARSSWVLSLDADERIAPKDHRKISRIIRFSRADGVELKRRIYTDRMNWFIGWRPMDGSYWAEERFSGKHGFVENQQVRLFRNDRRIHYDETIPVHESVRRSIMTFGGSVKRSDATIHDFGWQKGERLYRKKQKVYMEACLRQYREVINTELLFLNLAMAALWIQKDVDRAFFYAKRAVTENPHSAYSRYFLALLYREKGRYNEVLFQLGKVLKLKPSSPDAWWLKGVCLDECGDARKGSAYIRKALRIIPGHPVYLNSLGVALTHLGDHGGAAVLFKRSLGSLPCYYPASDNLRAITDGS